MERLLFTVQLKNSSAKIQLSFLDPLQVFCMVVAVRILMFECLGEVDRLLWNIKILLEPCLVTK